MTMTAYLTDREGEEEIEREEEEQLVARGYSIIVDIHAEGANQKVGDADERESGVSDARYPDDL